MNQILTATNVKQTNTQDEADISSTPSITQQFPPLGLGLCPRNEAVVGQIGVPEPGSGERFPRAPPLGWACPERGFE